jgi:hypothetical protein
MGRCRRSQQQHGRRRSQSPTIPRRARALPPEPASVVG